MIGIIVLAVVFVALLLVASVSPNVATLSQFEITRRRKKDGDKVGLDYLRELLFQDVISVQRVLAAALLVAVVLVSVAVFGWLIGSVVAIAVALEYGAAARLALVRTYGQKLYDTYEPQILAFLEKHRAITKWLRSVVPQGREVRISSKDELQDLVERSNAVLSEDEKKLIVRSLQFEHMTVGEVMTPKSVVETISQHEMLGPLVLDGLHKTGHSRFPVINGDIDHVVGILHVRDMLAVDGSRKHTARVESAMSKKVFYIREDHTLAQALSAFLRTHHHLFIVINEFRETVGILTLEDTLEALLGRKIIDEFDSHDDMRAVATRQAAERFNKSSEAVT